MMVLARFTLSKQDRDEMLVIVDKLDALLNEHHQLPTVMVLSRLLPSVWCDMNMFATADEALLMWRALAVEMEDWINQHFRRIHWAGDREKLQ